MKSKLEEASGVTVPVPDVLPALRRDLLRPPDATLLAPRARARHAPRILLLYGSLRERSYSRLLTEEATRLLEVRADVVALDLPAHDSDAPPCSDVLDATQAIAFHGRGVVLARMDFAQWFAEAMRIPPPTLIVVHDKDFAGASAVL